MTPQGTTVTQASTSKAPWSSRGCSLFTSKAGAEEAIEEAVVKLLAPGSPSEGKIIAFEDISKGLKPKG